MKPNDVRAFIAIELDADLRLKIKEIQKALKRSQADVTWVNPKNIHLTLKFLGHVSMESLQSLCQAIEDTAKKFLSFEFQISQCGWFPGQGQPQVLWIGIGPGNDAIKKLAAMLSSNIAKFCEKTDNKEFSAHITIGRVRSDKNINKLLARLKRADFQYNKKLKVDHITLFQSRLTKSGPKYTAIKGFSLK
ncbi:MAG: RNA 2',3'-cyclic phosphodiesterase [Candidatus Omnitrophota bacterium]